MKWRESEVAETGHCTVIPRAFQFMRFLRFNRLQFLGSDE